MEFVQRVFDLLKKQNKNKAELARYLGIRPTTVTEWGTKGKKPSLDYVSRIGEFLGVSCDYLLTGKEFSSSNLIFHELQLTEEQERLLSMYELLTEYEKGEIMGELKVMIRNKNISTKENVG